MIPSQAPWRLLFSTGTSCRQNESTVCMTSFLHSLSVSSFFSLSPILLFLPCNPFHQLVRCTLSVPSTPLVCLRPSIHYFPELNVSSYRFRVLVLVSDQSSASLSWHFSCHFSLMRSLSSHVVFVAAAALFASILTLRDSFSPSLSVPSSSPSKLSSHPHTFLFPLFCVRFETSARFR